MRSLASQRQLTSQSSRSVPSTLLYSLYNYVLQAYLTDLWTNLAIMDYPYPTNFLAPLPANPVLAACLPLATNYTEDQQLLGLVYQAASVYFNTSGEAKCLDLGQEDDIGADMWGYQVMKSSDSFKWCLRMLLL